MPTLGEAAAMAVPVSPPRKRWTREEVDRLESLGLLETSNLGVIEGNLLDRRLKNRRHA